MKRLRMLWKFSGLINEITEYPNGKIEIHLHNQCEIVHNNYNLYTEKNRYRNEPTS